MMTLSDLIPFSTRPPRVRGTFRIELHKTVDRSDEPAAVVDVAGATELSDAITEVERRHPGYFAGIVAGEMA